MLETKFGEAWAAMLWRAMSATGKGYRRPSLKNGREAPGEKSDRRGDKKPAEDHDGKPIGGEFVGVPKHFRSYAKRYSRA